MATREEVLAAYAANPKAEATPDEASINYWMINGLSQFNSMVDAVRAANPALAAQIDASRAAKPVPAPVPGLLTPAPAVPAAPVAPTAVAPVATPAVAVPSLKDQLLNQWSKLGITELGGGIPLEKRAADLADTMAQSGITNLADLKLGSTKIDTGEDGGIADVSFLNNKGQQLGFVGNVGDLEGKGQFLQPDNLVSWTAEGGGNVAYRAVPTADGGVAIVPQWNSSSDMKFIRDAAKLVAAVYGGGLVAEGLFGTLGAEAALTATDLAIGGGGLAGTGLTTAQLTAAGLSASEIAALTAQDLAIGGGGLGAFADLTAAEIAALTATDLAIGGTAGGAGLLGGAAVGAALTPAEIAALTATDLAIGGGGLGGTAGLTAAEVAGLTATDLAIGGGTAVGTGIGTGVGTGIGANVLGSGLSSLLSSDLTLGGGILQSETARKAAVAAQKMIEDETAAAKASAAFRPVGMTTRFGTSQFQVDPVTGRLTSAGYTLSPEAKAQQDRFVALSNAGLTQAEGAQKAFSPLETGAQSLFSLGNKYLAKSPEDVAKNYLAEQMALLQPGREIELANLQTKLRNQGRIGLSVAQGGNYGATTPELQALYNARARQEAELAANAQLAGQRDVMFGAGLLDQGSRTMGQYYSGQQGSYAPYTTAMGQVQSLEAAGQQPLTMGLNIGQQASTAGARVGQLGLEGAKLSTALATSDAATTNPYASLLGGLGASPAFATLGGGLLGSLFS